jgi:predicted RNase H-like HicB family nuclease
MSRKFSVVVEKDDDGFYVWCPKLKGCQSQGTTLAESLTHIREAIGLYFETLTKEERSEALKTKDPHQH